MVKREIEAENFDGKKETKSYYFNLTESELAKMDYKFAGGFEGLSKKIKDDPTAKDIIDTFEIIIGEAYGEKLPDGRFYKNKVNTEVFLASNAYSELFKWIINNPDDALNFVQAMMPTKVASAVTQPDPIVVIK